MRRDPVSVVVLAGSDAVITNRFLADLAAIVGSQDEVVVTTPCAALVQRYRLGTHAVVSADSPEARVPAAAAEAVNDLLLVVHEDVILTRHTIDTLVRVMKHTGAAAVGPRADHAPPLQRVADLAPLAGDRAGFRTYLRSHPPTGPESVEVGSLSDLCRLERKSGGKGAFVARHALIQHAGLRSCPDSHQEPVSAGAPLLSVALIVRDEEMNILEAIASAKAFADEIVVYDTGSTDRTVELAKAAGARVAQGSWDGHFARARNLAATHCKGEWILALDADERCEGDPRALRALLQSTRSEAFSVEQTNLDAKGDVLSRVATARIYRRATGLFYGRIHEQVLHSRLGRPMEREATTTLSLLHHGYRQDTLNDRAKGARNLTVARLALENADEPDGLGRANALVHLGRSAALLGQHDAALAALEDAWQLPLHAMLAVQAARAGVDAAAAMHEPATADRWVSRLRRCGEFGPRVTEYELRAALIRQDPDQVVALWQELPDSLDDELGIPYRRSEVPLTVAKSVAECADRLPTDQADELLDRVFLGRGMSDGAWRSVAGVAPQLSVLRALEWSARARQAGQASRCPLLAIARNEDRSIRDRVLAAAVAHEMYTDFEATEILMALLPIISDAEAPVVLAELEVLAPHLAAGLVVQTA